MMQPTLQIHTLSLPLLELCTPRQKNIISKLVKCIRWLMTVTPNVKLLTVTNITVF